MLQIELSSMWGRMIFGKSSQNSLKRISLNSLKHFKDLKFSCSSVDHFQQGEHTCFMAAWAEYMVTKILRNKRSQRHCNKVRKEGRKRTGLAREDSGEFYLQINLNRCALCAS